MKTKKIKTESEIKIEFLEPHTGIIHMGEKAYFELKNIKYEMWFSKDGLTIQRSLDNAQKLVHIDISNTIEKAVEELEQKDENLWT